MCVASRPADFSGTTVYAGEVHLPGEAVIHVGGYQNKVKNLADGPNAMLLHIPAKGGMSQRNFISVENCPHILSDMVNAIDSSTRGNVMMGLSRGMPEGVEIFEHDIYTIVVARHAQDIPEVLNMVRADKRPPVNRELFIWYGMEWSDYSVALCCFNNRDASKAMPMMWQYEPLYPDTLFAPGMDCHTGEVPDLKTMVRRDHHVIFGSDLMKDRAGDRVRYTDLLPREVMRYLPGQVVGLTMSGTYPNGDFIASVASAQNGRCDMKIGVLQ